MPVYQLVDRTQVHPNDVYTLVIERVRVAAHSGNEKEGTEEVAYFKANERPAAEAVVSLLNAEIWRAIQ